MRWAASELLTTVDRVDLAAVLLADALVHALRAGALHAHGDAGILGLERLGDALGHGQVDRRVPDDLALLLRRLDQLRRDLARRRRRGGCWPAGERQRQRRGCEPRNETAPGERWPRHVVSSLFFEAPKYARPPQASAAGPTPAHRRQRSSEAGRAFKRARDARRSNLRRVVERVHVRWPRDLALAARKPCRLRKYFPDQAIPRDTRLHKLARRPARTPALAPYCCNATSNQSQPEIPCRRHCRAERSAFLRRSPCSRSRSRVASRASPMPRGPRRLRRR